MGGPTSRTLIQLLEHGDADEAGFEPGPREAPSSALFAGGKKWVHSVTSVSGVHNGALTADDVGQFDLHPRSHGQHGSACRTATSGARSTTSTCCNGDWNEEGQGFDDDIRRAFESPVWKTQDGCIYDLSTIAAHFQNSWAQTSENVYYSSYAVDGTFAGPQGIRIPQANMNVILAERRSGRVEQKGPSWRFCRVASE